jgi:hypothetical protein
MGSTEAKVEEITEAARMSMLNKLLGLMSVLNFMDAVHFMLGSRRGAKVRLAPQISRNEFPKLNLIEFQGSSAMELLAKRLPADVGGTNSYVFDDGGKSSEAQFCYLFADEGLNHYRYI